MTTYKYGVVKYPGQFLSDIGNAEGYVFRTFTLLLHFVF